MPREGADAKGRRYLVEGRLTVELVDGEYIDAKCRGTDTVHVLGHRPTHGWFCSCRLRTGRRSTCSHLVALQLVTVRRTKESNR
jgi:hypothetical protein